MIPHVPHNEKTNATIQLHHLRALAKICSTPLFIPPSHHTFYQPGLRERGANLKMDQGEKVKEKSKERASGYLRGGYWHERESPKRSQEPTIVVP